MNASRLFIVILLLLAHCTVLCAATYNIIDLGTLGGATSYAVDINASGQVVGSAAIVGNARRDPALFSAGSNVDLGTLGGTLSSAAAINTAGVVVGYTQTVGDSATRAFVAFGGAFVDIGTLGGANAQAQSLNDSGQIAGFADTPTATHAFRYEQGKMTDLGTLAGGAVSYGFGINAAGHVVGRSNSTGGNYLAFLHDGTSMISLGALASGNNSTANAINDHDQIVGYSNLVNNSADTHPFLYENGQMKDLGTLGGAYGLAYAINNSGQIVGEAETSGAAEHAFLYQGGQMTDLNDLIPAGSGWELIYASAINDKGQIAGTGILNGQTRAFLLTPIDGGSSGSGAGSQYPRIYVNGARRISTTTRRIQLSGSSGGDVAAVLYRLNGKGAYRKTRGQVSGWKIALSLKPGRNTFQVIAVSPAGERTRPARVVILRKAA